MTYLTTVCVAAVAFEHSAWTTIEVFMLHRFREAVLSRRIVRVDTENGRSRQQRRRWQRLLSLMSPRNGVQEKPSYPEVRMTRSLLIVR